MEIILQGETKITKRFQKPITPIIRIHEIPQKRLYAYRSSRWSHYGRLKVLVIFTRKNIFRIQTAEVLCLHKCCCLLSIFFPHRWSTESRFRSRHALVISWERTDRAITRELRLDWAWKWPSFWNCENSLSSKINIYVQLVCFYSFLFDCEHHLVLTLDFESVYLRII